jgi:hypothetical protein
MEDLARLEVECGGGVSYQLGAAGGSMLGRGLGCGLLLLWYGLIFFLFVSLDKGLNFVFTTHTTS